MRRLQDVGLDLVLFFCFGRDAKYEEQLPAVLHPEFFSVYKLKPLKNDGGIGSFRLRLPELGFLGPHFFRSELLKFGGDNSLCISLLAGFYTSHVGDEEQIPASMPKKNPQGIGGVLSGSLEDWKLIPRGPGS